MGGYDVHNVEAVWQQAWDQSGCHRAPRRPGRERYFVHDAAPFPNGSLHLGHVRTYVLGDLTARYQRALGKDVLYHTGFDAFGLPIELEAIEQGVSPAELVSRSVRVMTRQLRALGISYDWSLVPNTSDPRVYRWTQWLFLEMFDAGLVERRLAPLHWCPRCRTTLARIQIEDGTCWRCGSRVEQRRFPQWFIRISRYAKRLRRTLQWLEGWGEQARAILRNLLEDPGDDAASQAGSHGGLDWLVSRQRSWGTPIPLVHCRSCGVVAVPRDRLPVLLPGDLDWSGGSGALARSTPFVETSCPSCGRRARRETDTLDCFFDDIWCFLQALVLDSETPGFTRDNLAAWLPVDRAQSGLDTVYYFHLYRFLGCFLAERGLVDDPEMIRNFLGNDLVLAGGRKMSKHLGNAVSPDAILREYGADALRVAMLRAAGPQRPIRWSRDLLQRSRAFLDAVYALVARTGGRVAPGAHDERSPHVSRAARALSISNQRALSLVSRFIEEYRPHAALAVLDEARRRIERFAATRVDTGRLREPDRRVLAGVIDEFVLALAPFAPHLAEECRQLSGHEDPACAARWPGRRRADTRRGSTGRATRAG